MHVCLGHACKGFNYKGEVRRAPDYPTLKPAPVTMARLAYGPAVRGAWAPWRCVAGLIPKLILSWADRGKALP